MGIPAYRVLTNATIDRIAETWPINTEQLESISGVGPATIEQFGYDIVELVRQQEAPSAVIDSEEPEDASAPLTPGPAATTDPESPATSTSLPEKDSTAAWDSTDAYWTWRLFHDGYSAAQIERIRRRDTDSLANDLALAAQAGKFVDPSWIPAAEVVSRR